VNEDHDRGALLRDKQDENTSPIQIAALQGHLALIIAVVFTGAAVYMKIVEQPARLQLDDQALFAEWQLSYERGFAMQAPFAILAGILGIAAFNARHDGRWLLGAAVIVANWPYTLSVTK